MAAVIEFTVYGKSQPKGSAKAFMRKGARFPTVTSDNPKVKDWQREVGLAAQCQAAGVLNGALITGPVRLELRFVLTKPKSMAKAVTHHLKKPDLDKLARACKDALTGVVYKDDSQVVALWAVKMYQKHADETPHVAIRVEDVSGDQP